MTDEIKPNQMTKNEFMASYGHCDVSLERIQADSYKVGTVRSVTKTYIIMSGYFGMKKEFQIYVKFCTAYNIGIIKKGISPSHVYKVHQFDAEYMAVRSVETGKIVNECSIQFDISKYTQ
jgi:hypothetical protein